MMMLRSEKALVDYSNGNQWIAQISEFVEQVSRDQGQGGTAGATPLLDELRCQVQCVVGC